jgi:hypothetical protein
VHGDLLGGEITFARIESRSDLLALVIVETLRVLGDQDKRLGLMRLLVIQASFSGNHVVADVACGVVDSPRTIGREVRGARQPVVADLFAKGITVEEFGVVTVVGHTSNLARLQVAAITPTPRSLR